MCFLIGCQQAPSTTSVTASTDAAKTVAKATNQNEHLKAAINNAKKDTLAPGKTLNKRQRNYTTEQSRPKTKIDKAYPFDIPLKTADGKVTYSNEVLSKDKPTVLLFWLTTCYPCRIEMEAVNKVYAEWAKEDDFNLLAISTDFPKNYPKFVDRVNKKNYPWTSYHDMHREFRHVLPGGLNGLPQTFVFDKNGEVAYHKRKYSSGDELKLIAKVKELNTL